MPSPYRFSASSCWLLLIWALLGLVSSEPPEILRVETCWGLDSRLLEDFWFWVFGWFALPLFDVLAFYSAIFPWINPFKFWLYWKASVQMSCYISSFASIIFFSSSCIGTAIFLSRGKTVLMRWRIFRAHLVFMTCFFGFSMQTFKNWNRIVWIFSTIFSRCSNVTI